MHKELIAMGKLDANKKQKETSLLDTAFNLFTTKGLNKTSISEIVSNAGVAKGTFYLYFKDKYDIRNFLIARKAGEVFARADEELKNTDLTSLEDRIVFLADHIISQFSKDRTLLVFISKNLSWAIFKKQLLSAPDEEMDLPGIIREAFETSHTRYRNPEVMIFMILELLSGTIYSSILYEDPLPIDELKPYLFDSIRSIMRSQEI